MSRKKLAIAAVSTAAVAALVFGAPALAAAGAGAAGQAPTASATTPTPDPSAPATDSGSADSGKRGGPDGERVGPGGERGERGGERGGPGRGGNHTEVTGDELAKVTAAVKAKDSAATVERAHKHDDGSYHALATKNGARVMYQVSADLTTVTERTAKDRPGRGTEVTGDELTKVTAAIKAKDSAVTVGKVFKGADGKYRAFGSKGDSKVMFVVSADLSSVTQSTGGPGGRGGKGKSGK